MILHETRLDELNLIQADGFSFVPHVHRHCELFLCTRGSVEASCGGRSQKLKRGDVMVALPNYVHSYQETDWGQCLIAIVDPDLFPALTVQLSCHCDNCFYSGGEEMACLSEQLLTAYKQGASRAVLIGYLYVILGTALSHMALTHQPLMSLDLFSRVLAYAGENFRRELSLTDTARHFGVTHNYLSKLFHQRLGYGFLEYLHILRINESKILLSESTKSIGEIAFDTGFSTQRTFNRVFARLTGTTPKQYREREKSRL